MIYILQFAQFAYRLDFLAINIGFLWRLVLIFSGLGGLCFLLIFYFRNRLRSQEHNAETRKKVLFPMIRNYLLQQVESKQENEADMLWIKMEIRNLLKNPMDRSVIKEIMLDVQRDALPATQRHVSELYQYFDLHHSALRNLESRKWDRISRAIAELTEMHVSQAYDAIKEHINSKNSIVRKQAQLATVQLKDEGIQYFLDTARYPISQWQQVKILEILTSNPGMKLPRFRDWLISENQDVVLFALRLIRVFRQMDANTALLMFLNHNSERIQVSAMDCIADFQYKEARQPLKDCFNTASSDLKIHILNTLQAIGDVADIPWVEQQITTDTSFLVRSKARLVVGALQPVLGLSEKGIQEELELWTSPQHNTSSENISDRPEASMGSGDLFSSETLLLKTLKPDFSTVASRKSLQDLRTTVDSGIEEYLIETPEFHPQETWSEEDELVFGDCILEELLDILTPERDREVWPAFLTLVIESIEKTFEGITNEQEPEWIRELEVVVEQLSGASGYLGILREVLLEELRETEHVLQTEFVPGTGDGHPPKSGDDEPIDSGEFSNDEEKFSEMLLPEFDVNSEDIHPLNKAQGVPNSRNHEDTETGGYSIFGAFFESYDTESKLILLDQIHAIGGQKELQFLKGLFSDSDHRIRAKVRKEYALLRKQLEATGTSDAPEEPSVFWRSSDKEQPYSQTSGNEEQPNEEEFNFSPDPDFHFPHEGSPEKDLHTEGEDGYHRFLNYLRGNKNDTDA
jgi:hypothetical protein